MEVYDKVHSLATSIKNSQEYVEFKAIKDKIKQVPELKIKLMNLKKSVMKNNY